MKKAKLQQTLFLGIFCLSLLQQACTPAFQAEYTDPHALTLIDDRWTQSDIDNIGVLIQHLNKKVSRNPKKFGVNPTVILRDIENRTDEHIDTNPIKNKIIDELTNADAFSFVDAEARKDIADEMKYQHNSGMVDQASAAKTGKQKGANFFLRGGISSTVNTQEGRKIVTYQVNLKLTDIQGGTILWAKQYSTRKDMKRASGTW